MTANPLSPASPFIVAPQAPAGIARFTPLDPLRVIRQNLTLLGAVLVLGIFAGVVLALALEKFAPEYTSEAYIEVSGGIVSPYDPPSATGTITKFRLDELAAFIKNQVVRLKSDEVILAALSRQKVQETRWYQQFSNNAERREVLQEKLDANRVIGSTVIRVALSGQYPEDLGYIIDAVIDEYISMYQSAATTANVDVRRTFERERRRAEDELKLYQTQLDQFLKQNDLPTLETHNNESTIGYQDLAVQVARMAMNLQTARANLANLEASHREGTVIYSPNDIAAVEADSAISLRNERLRTLREQREVLMHRFGEQHRSVLDTERHMVAVEQEKQREMERLLRERQELLMDQAKKMVASLESQMAAMLPRLEAARAVMRDLVQKLERYRQLNEQAEMAKRKVDQADEFLYRENIMRERPDRSGVTKLAEAGAPKLTFPHFPGVVAGVAILFEAIALTLVFVRELMDQRIKSPADVKLIPQAEVLGVVPDAAEDPAGPSNIENVAQRDPNGLLAEAFRQTRTSLLTQVNRGGLRTVMVVGAQAEAGVSSVVNNLAISLCGDGRRVLVIDANIRRPGQHRLFMTRSMPGLVDVLSGRNTFEDAVVRLSEPRLDVLSAGDANVAMHELLEGAAFQNLLDLVSSRYDLVLIDAPPALLTGESKMIAKQVNGVLLVVRANRDMRGMVGRMIREMQAQDANLLGIVLNGVQASAGGYFRANFDEFHRYRQSAAARGRTGDGGNDGTGAGEDSAEPAPVGTDDSDRK